MSMQDMLTNMQLIFTSMTGWINSVIQMFFVNPVTFFLFAIPIATFLILTVIVILKALFK